MAKDKDKDKPAADAPADKPAETAPAATLEAETAPAATLEAISAPAATLVQIGRPGHFINPNAVLELNVSEGNSRNAVRLAGEASFKPISNEDTAKLLAVCSVITD